MLNSTTIVVRPTPVGFENLMEIAATRWEGRDPDAGMRACAWTSLLQLRRQHGSLAEAREVARLRQRIACGPLEGRAS